MNNAQFIEDLSIKIKDILKSSPMGDLEKNVHALLQGAFTKLELVSREEFDVQAGVLRHTREKLDLLESKLTQLETVLQKSNIKS
ncbi:MAG TPA: accessory factor UbiK family protein [Methylophilaceae bacterium]